MVPYDLSGYAAWLVHLSFSVLLSLKRFCNYNFLKDARKWSAYKARSINTIRSGRFPFSWGIFEVTGTESLTMNKGKQSFKVVLVFAIVLTEKGLVFAVPQTNIFVSRFQAPLDCSSHRQMLEWIKEIYPRWKSILTSDKVNCLWKLISFKMKYWTLSCYND